MPLDTYMKNLYLNIWEYKDNKYPFQIFTGARGFGKTYSALGGCLGIAEFCERNEGEKFILMRRTQDELESLSDGRSGEGVNPFKPLNKAYGRNVGIIPIKKKVHGIYNREHCDDGTDKASGAPIGYGVALSTIGTVRGVSLEDATDCIYDEFIPENHVRAMRDEFSAFANAYETINRNREIAGLPALRMWLLSNANRIDNEIFTGLGIVSDVEKMINSGKEHKYYPSRGLAVHIMPPSPQFLKEKQQTALYKLTAGTKFYDMALNNEFAFDDFSCVGHLNLRGYIPFCALDNAYIYQKKGAREFYVTYAPCKCPHFDSSIKADVACFQREYGVLLHDPYIYGCITFESYALKALLSELIL